MKYIIQLGIRYEESNWRLDTFRQDRRNYFLKLIEKYKHFNGHYLDGYEIVEFPNGTLELEQLLREECESKEITYDIGAGITYSPREIRNARFVPLLTECGPLDSDKAGIPLNRYETIVCGACGRCDESKVPNPYRISKKILKKPPDIFKASNGIIVLSERAFDLLWDDIKQWVKAGEVVIWDKGQVLGCPVKYKWVRPTNKVGDFMDAKVLQRCNKCDKPKEIREVRSEDIFEMNKEIVESFKKVSAPIALAGNWFGEIEPGRACSNLWEVFISGALHEKIRKLKLKGFVKADCVIHAADEPYDWDPLKNNPLVHLGSGKK
jgi:hypothetical protein